ncbi:unnamed protein product [Caenorhabditis brenneri]
MEEQRRAAKLAEALEEPFVFNLQNRMMSEITEQIKMETDTVVDTVSSPRLSIRLVSPHQSSVMDASFVDGTEDQRNPALLDDSSAATQSHLNHSELHSRTTPSGIGPGT